MKIEISNATVAPMTAWLKDGRESGNRDEKKLRQILSMPDYEIEFRRYGDPNLPVCGISFEEAVDFSFTLMRRLLRIPGFPARRNPF